MKKLILLFVALVAISCGNGGDKDEGPCAQRSGTYSTTLAERSGTCGPISESVDTIDVQPVAPDPPCTGSISYSADNCVVTFNSRCPEPGIGAGFGSSTEGRAEWNESGSRGTGVAEVTIFAPDSTVYCRSTYNMTVTRL